MVDFTRSPTDTLTLSDSGSGLTHILVGSELVEITDAGQIPSMQVAGIELVRLTDSVSTLLTDTGSTRTVNDTLGLSDSVLAGKFIDRTFNESVFILDADHPEISAAGWIEFLSEVAGIGDLVARGNTTEVAVNDTVVVLDSGQSAGYVEEFADPLALTDATTFVGNKVVTLSSDLLINEQMTLQGVTTNRTASASSAMDLTDSVVMIMSTSRSASDVMSMTDDELTAVVELSTERQDVTVLVGGTVVISRVIIDTTRQDTVIVGDNQIGSVSIGQTVHERN